MSLETVDQIYVPSEWQQRFHFSTEHEVFGAGSAGPGKSWALLADPMQILIVEHARMLRDPRIVPWIKEGDPLWERILRFPIRKGRSHFWGLHLRRQEKMLGETMKRAHMLWTAFDPGVKWKEKNKWFEFSSGARVQYDHCKDRKDWVGYYSSEFQHISYDELVQFEREQYEQINTRLRSADPILGPVPDEKWPGMMKIRAMSNPMQERAASNNIEVSDPQWVKKYFVDPAPNGNVVLVTRVKTRHGMKEHTRLYMPATLYDNPDKAFVEQYEFQLMTKPAHIRAALLYGSWEVTAGSYHGEEWNRNLHVIKPFRVPDHWPVFRSMDWGYKNPGCVHWWALDEDDNLFCIHELTFQRRNATDVAKDIRDIEQRMGLWDKQKAQSTITGPADDQLWEERGSSAKSKAAEMLDVGVTWSKANKKSRVANAMKLSERLKDHANGTTLPGIVFFDTCGRIIHTLPGIQTDPDNSEKPQDGGDDHWYDSTLYAVAHVSHGRTAVVRLDEDEDDRFADDYSPGESNYGAGMAY